MNRLYWAGVVFALLPVILFWKLILEPLAWLADFAMDHKQEVFAVIIALVFIFGQFTIIWHITHTPGAEKRIKEYRRNCDQPGMRAC